MITITMLHMLQLLNSAEFTLGELQELTEELAYYHQLLDEIIKSRPGYQRDLDIAMMKEYSLDFSIVCISWIIQATLSSGRREALEHLREFTNKFNYDQAVHYFDSALFATNELLLTSQPTVHEKTFSNLITTLQNLTEEELLQKINECNQSIAEKESNFLYHHLVRGMIYCRLKKFMEAHNDFDFVYSSAPVTRSNVVLNNLKMAYACLGREYYQQKNIKGILRITDCIDNIRQLDSGKIKVSFNMSSTASFSISCLDVTLQICNPNFSLKQYNQFIANHAKCGRHIYFKRALANLVQGHFDMVKSDFGKITNQSKVLEQLFCDVSICAAHKTDSDNSHFVSFSLSFSVEKLELIRSLTTNSAVQQDVCYSLASKLVRLPENKKNNLSKALQYINQAIALKEDNFLSYLIRARIYLEYYQFLSSSPLFTQDKTTLFFHLKKFSPKLTKGFANLKKALELNPLAFQHDPANWHNFCNQIYRFESMKYKRDGEEVNYENIIEAIWYLFQHVIAYPADTTATFIFFIREHKEEEFFQVLQGKMKGADQPTSIRCLAYVLEQEHLYLYSPMIKKETILTPYYHAIIEEIKNQLPRVLAVTKGMFIASATKYSLSLYSQAPCDIRRIILSKVAGDLADLINDYGIEILSRRLNDQDRSHDIVRKYLHAYFFANQPQLADRQHIPSFTYHNF